MSNLFINLSEQNVSGELAILLLLTFAFYNFIKLYIIMKQYYPPLDSFVPLITLKNTMNLSFSIYLKSLLMLSFLFTATFVNLYGQTTTNNSQWGKNGPVSAPLTSGLNWANGNAQGSNSHFTEGQSAPTRIEMTGLTTGVPTSMTFNINITQGNGGKHAFDFFTGPNRINELVDPLSGLSGYGPVNTSFAFPIPTAANTGGVAASFYDETAPKMACQQAFDNAQGHPERNAIWIYNGTVTNITYLWGNENAANTEQTYCTVTFTPSSTQVLLVVGCHIAQEGTLDGCAGWGIGNGATAISGSPYHFHNDKICTPLANCVNLGSQDQQLSSSAVCAPPTVAITGNNTVCSGTSTTLTATPTPAGTYTYQWSTVVGTVVTPIGGATSATLTTSPTATTTYRVTVHTTSNGGCDGIKDYVVTVNPLPTANAVASPILCFGGNGSVNLTVSGGTPTYTYLWNNAATTEDLSSVPAGNYSVVVTDSKGCKANASATIAPAPSAVTISATSGKIKCFGGTADITIVTGGGTGAITVSPATTTGLTAGTYTFTATDANGCTASTSATIGAAPPALTLGTCSKTDATCAGANTGSVAAGIVNNAVGTIKYSWTNAANTIVGSTATVNSLPAGTYTLTVKDDCSTIKCSVTIGTPTCVQPFCTYTIGFWGNGNGRAGNGMRGTEILTALVTQANPVVIGTGGAVGSCGYTLASSTCVLGLLPGGGPSVPLAKNTAAYNCTTKSTNTLVSQIVGLTINLRYNMTYKSLNLGNTPLSQTCALSNSLITQLGFTSTSTVNDLIKKANDYLACNCSNTCGSYPSSFGSTLNSAATALNEYWDNCAVSTTCAFSPVAPRIQTTTTTELVAYSQTYKVDLVWQIKGDNMVDYVNVKKRNPVTGDFEIIETINNRYSYSTSDNKPKEGENEYLVEAVMVDKQTVKSVAKKVHFNRIQEVTVVPNPTIDVAQVTFEMDSEKQSTIQIADINGKILKKMDYQATIGTNRVAFNVNDFLMGTYIVTIKTYDKLMTGRLVVIK